MSTPANVPFSIVSDASESLALLAKLIAFDTTSYNSNLALIGFITTYLTHDNIRLTLNYNAEKTKANLFASVGRADVAGVLLSGHTDVVPVAGQAWHTDPFVATHKDGKIYGRGTADMKGFIACALVIVKQAALQESSDVPLSAPLHLCLSYDEEIGCVGVRGILDQLSSLMCPPRVAIIGEPTLMQVATGHKGKAVFQVGCFGQEGHSALAPNFSNAIHVASEFVQSLVASQRHFEQQGQQDKAYDIPYSTIHVGKIQGGKALNIVPNFCQIDYEIRHIAEESVEHIQATIVEHFTQSDFNKKLLAGHTSSHSSPSYNPLLPIEITQPNAYPGLNTNAEHTAVQSINQLLPTTKPTTKISFGTEGGLFYQTLGCPIVVCGPGSIEVAHKPDEYIEVSQMAACDAFLQRLLASLSS